MERETGLAELDRAKLVGRAVFALGGSAILKYVWV